MTAISEVFKNLKEQGKSALVAYIMGGDPELSQTKEIAEALIRGGADILELGIPFSDPIADGPTIQAASLRSLNSGTTPKMILELARKIKNTHDVPVVIMTYYNPVFKIGLEKFFALAKDCLVDGIIVPDLPVEEAEDYKRVAEEFEIDTIFLVAPSTSNERLAKIVDYSSGFLYLVSHFGVTGAKASVEKSTLTLIDSVSTSISGRIPLVVGFGVSKSEHVKSLIKAGADGVIVGSLFVNIICNNLSDKQSMLAEITKTALELKAATL
jgi:tryptophan synthase alpha chain